MTPTLAELIDIYDDVTHLGFQEAQHDIGTLEVGKAAHLVAFEANPTTDASAFSHVAAVL